MMCCCQSCCVDDVAAAAVLDDVAAAAVAPALAAVVVAAAPKVSDTDKDVILPEIESEEIETTIVQRWRILFKFPIFVGCFKKFADFIALVYIESCSFNTYLKQRY